MLPSNFDVLKAITPARRKATRFGAPLSFSLSVISVAADGSIPQRLEIQSRTLADFSEFVMRNCYAFCIAASSTREATLTGFEPIFEISLTRAIPAEICTDQRVNSTCRKLPVCTNRAELRSFSVRICPEIRRMYGARFDVVGSKYPDSPRT